MGHVYIFTLPYYISPIQMHFQGTVDRAKLFAVCLSQLCFQMDVFITHRKCMKI